MSQGSQGNGLMMQPGGGFRQYDHSNSASQRNPAPQIYSAIYSGVDVYEMEVNGIAVMRRRKDSWLNATQILKVAGIEKGKRTKVLEKEILIGEHEKVQGGYGKYQGTWIKFDRGLEFCRQYGVEELLRSLLTYDMGQDGGIAGRGGIDTPTKEQAMAAQRKRLYNSGADSRERGPSGTFFKNISSTASHAVAAISKARFDSPVPRMRNGTQTGRPTSFSRQSSQPHLASQENAYPGGSQQSMQSFASADSFAVSGQPDSAYATQFSHPGRDDARNGDLEEPPRKRIRRSPSINGQYLDDNYLNMSMREASPTEPNESFVYHNQHIQIEGGNSPLPPLPMPSNLQSSAKKDLLMSLFTTQEDFTNHKAFQSLSSEDLDIPIDASCNTALIWAATLARHNLLKALISHGASIFRVNSSGETALMRSCLVTNNLEAGSFADILELLGPSIEIRDTRGRTVLHHIAVTSAVKGRSQASKYHLETLLEFVVRQGSAPDSQQSFSNVPPPLTTLGIGRFMSEVVNIQDRSGDTALNIASRIGNRSIISQLIEVGADASIANRSNLSPMDFGVGDPTEFERRPGEERVQNKTMSNERKETSDEIITSIATLLNQTGSEFTKEMDRKQTVIDDLHAQLRDASGELGEQRRKVEMLQAEAKERDARKTKTANLRRAYDEERVRLSQMQSQYGQIDGAVEMKLGDADQGLAITEQASSILARIHVSPHQPLVIDRVDRQALSSSLPPAHVLRARLNAYRAVNQELDDNIRDLQSKSSELARKYRQIISLCTSTPESNVDNVIDNLTRAVESEHTDVELTRVREFLQRVEGS
ncbi:related to transcription factor [Rhynchosporium secalis]|uniref:Transcription factor SWI6 n=1 Tax=Rhynchosporium secalis TaxID=38038 RepID=A0A1E1M8H6_RHYSE|nr:related to transcription factor [Rhynchosporium secalis]